MKMDPTTESIAHFIGLFDLLVEELRLRQKYLEFRQKKTAEDDAATIEAGSVRLDAPYALGRFDPGLDYKPNAPALPPVVDPPSVADAAYELAEPPELERVAPDEPDVATVNIRMIEIDIEAPPFRFALAVPGSIVAVTLQSVGLNDNDLFLNGLGTQFTDPAVLEQALQTLVIVAETLTAFDVPELPLDGDWIGFAQDMLARMDASSVAGGSAEISTFRGADAHGIIIDGVAADEVPDWMELLPEYLRPEKDERLESAAEEVEGNADRDPSQPAPDGETVVYATDGPGGTGETRLLEEYDFSRDFGDGTPNPLGLEPGHKIVAGANKAINEIAIGSQWIDAPVIVVRGDVAKFDAVSQVNVLVEHDTIDGRAVGQSSVGHNIVEILTESSEDPGKAPPPADVLPEAWQVIRVEADLLQLNWVKQVTFVTDFDRAEVTFSGSASFIGLGQNEIVNSAVLNELGYSFDLVFVAGDMIDGTVLSQKNVLLDSDKVMTGAPETTRAKLDTPTVSPVAMHGDTVVPSEDALSGPDAWFRSGERTDESSTGGSAAADAPPPRISAGPEASEPQAEPLNDPVGPADAEVATQSGGTGEAVATEASDAPEITTTVEPEPAPMSLADNLLLNKATLKTTGADSFVEMTEAFAATAEQLAEGAETIAREVAQDALFAGKEALRVLQIDGDLTKLNILQQTNIVGDADQIRLEMHALRDQLEAEMKLIAGSNALVNLATVMKHGVDSKIMAGGHVYDDAFIHQAELFDIDAAPSGVAVSGLAKEAVAAFLSDDMVALAETTDEIVPTSNYESTHLDVMQTALT